MSLFPLGRWYRTFIKFSMCLIPFKYKDIPPGYLAYNGSCSGDSDSSNWAYKTFSCEATANKEITEKSPVICFTFLIAKDNFCTNKSFNKLFLLVKCLNYCLSKHVLQNSSFVRFNGVIWKETSLKIKWFTDVEFNKLFKQVAFSQVRFLRPIHMVKCSVTL